MYSEVNQIICCDELDKLQTTSIKNSMILSSPHFDNDDSLFTELLVGDSSFKEISENEESDCPVIIKLNDKDELEFLQVLGIKIPRLDIKSIFIEGDILLIERNNGTAVRAVNSESSNDLIRKVARELRVLVKDESLKILNSRWEMI